MGLNMSQMFVRKVDPDAVMRMIGTAWAQVIANDADPPLRQLEVLVTESEWAAVLDSTSLLPRELAPRVAAETGGEAVWISISSTTLTYTVLRVDGSATVMDQSFPGADKDGLLPYYIDAEWEAWKFMSELGIPPHYRMIRFKDVAAQEAIPDHANMLLVQREKPHAPTQRAFFRHAVEEAPESSGPLPEFSIYDDDGKKVVDLYVIYGVMQDERVDHLLQTIDQVARRKPRPADYAYQARIKLYTDDRGVQEAAQKILRDRYAALAETQPFSFTL